MLGIKTGEFIIPTVKYPLIVFRDLSPALSSPLTSLSSLDDMDERVAEENRPSLKTEDLKVAQASVSFPFNEHVSHLLQMLLGLGVSKRNGMRFNLPNSNGMKYRQRVDNAVQTVPEQSVSNLGRATRAAKSVFKVKPMIIEELVN